MSFVALAIGLVVGNILHPGFRPPPGRRREGRRPHQAATITEGPVDFVRGIIPTTLVSAFTEGQVLQTLLVAAARRLRPAGARHGR